MNKYFIKLNININYIMYYEKNNILVRSRCRNCNYMFFIVKYKNNNFCTKDCYSSYNLKYCKKKMKLIQDLNN